MQIVCEATQSSAVNVQVGAFECLVRIMTLYYDKMAFYMERALFGVCRRCSCTPYHLIHIDLSVDRHGNEAPGRINCAASHRILVYCV